MKKLSIIIPVYNEKNTILKLLEKVEKVNFGEIEKEIIIVDDFSTDGTREILEKLKNEYKIIFHEKNLGKGGAVRTGYKNAFGDWIINQDADLEYNPNDIVRLINKIFETEKSVVYGSRLANGIYDKIHFFGENKTPLFLHYIGNKFLSFVTGFICGQKITDMETCYKLIPLSVIRSLDLKSDNFNIEPEVTVKLLKRGYKILEIPIEYNPRFYNEGKKIHWKDGFGAVWTLVKYKFYD